ncbi:MAG: hypothetical protein KJ061_17070 [Vicinamibacteraceae bacterium]|nr:hypothetical protein [Vicinamibacteraceae bacterium]
MTIPRSSARPMVAMTRLTARSMLAMAVSILAVCGAARVEAQDAGVPMAPPVTTAGDFAPHVARSYGRPVEEVAAAVEATLRQLRFKRRRKGRRSSRAGSACGVRSWRVCSVIRTRSTRRCGCS